MATLTSRELTQVARHFDAFRAVAGFGVIRTRADYTRAMALIAAILDVTRNNPAREDSAHPLTPLLDFLSAGVRDYEAEHWALPVASGREVLRLLMQQNGMTQSDLPEIGNQSVVSQILSGHRLLNARQIAALTRRFRVGADAFIGARTTAH